VRGGDGSGSYRRGEGPWTHFPIPFFPPSPMGKSVLSFSGKRGEKNRSPCHPELRRKRERGGHGAHANATYGKRSYRPSLVSPSQGGGGEREGESVNLRGKERKRNLLLHVKGGEKEEKEEQGRSAGASLIPQKKKEGPRNGHERSVPPLPERGGLPKRKLRRYIIED